MTQELLDKANSLQRTLNYTQKRYDTLLGAVVGQHEITITIQVGAQSIIIPDYSFSESAKTFLGQYRNEVLNDLTALQDELKNL